MVGSDSGYVISWTNVTKRPWGILSTRLDAKEWYGSFQMHDINFHVQRFGRMDQSYYSLQSWPVHFKFRLADGTDIVEKDKDKDGSKPTYSSSSSNLEGAARTGVEAETEAHHSLELMRPIQPNISR